MKPHIENIHEILRNKRYILNTIKGLFSLS